MLLLRGRVRLVAYGVDRLEVVLALWGPGDLIGEMAALGAGRGPPRASLWTRSRSASSREKLLNFLREDPDTGLVVIQSRPRSLSGPLGPLTERYSRNTNATRSEASEDGHGWARTSDLSRVKRALSH